jgi:membrane protein required for colicin V production
MNALDWIFLAIIGLLGIRCLVRGLVEELLSVAAFVVGLLSALLLYKPGGAFLKERFGLATLPEAIAFAAIFLIGFLLVKLLEKLIREGLEAAHLDKLDRILGLVLGLAEGIIVVSLILIVMSVQPLFDVKKLLEGSAFARFILPIVGPEVAKATQGISLPQPKLKVEIQPPAIKKP